MFVKIVAGVFLVVALFLCFVATREGKFKYERSGLINAKPEVIYPYISQFKLGQQWSPYEKDPDMKRTFGGPEGLPGSFEEWEGKQMGSGRIEITSVIPNRQVNLHLQMIKPFAADNQVTYTLTPDGDATRFTWSMEGDGGFMGKLMGVFIDCDKMIAGQFDEGIANLKTLIEKNSTLEKKPLPHSEVTVAPRHFVFVEKIGPFQTTAKEAWDEVHTAMAKLKNIKGAMALYKFKPEMTYRAGVIVSKKPVHLPEGLKYEEVAGGKYEKFTYVGSYSNLGAVSGEVWETAKTLKVRDGWAIENYANDPKTTPEDQLITEIMVPIQ